MIVVVQVFLCLLYCSTVDSATVISVTPIESCSASSHCNLFDDTIQYLSSNTRLQLDHGVHLLSNSTNNRDLEDVSIIGDPSDPSRVVIQCIGRNGFVFFSIKGLTISGVTFQNCANNGTEDRPVLNMGRETIDIFVRSQEDLSTAILLIDCEDFIFSDSIIQNSVGLGLIGINVVGTSSMTDVEFLHNSPEECIDVQEVSFTAGSGGGFVFLYHDYREQVGLLNDNSTFAIERCTISHNYNCRRDVFTTQFNRLSRTLDRNQFELELLGAAGGTFILGQATYAMNISVLDSTFTNNTGLYHNSALEMLIFNSTHQSFFLVRDCVFSDNGGLFARIGPGNDFPGNGLDPFGALGLTVSIPLPPDALQLESIHTPEPTVVKIENCLFSNNQALSGGGLSVFSFSTTTGEVENIIHVEKCNFTGNTGEYGSAIFITELSYSSFEAKLRVSMDSITVDSNSVLSETESLIFQSEGSSAVHMTSIQVEFTGSNSFRNNMHTAVFATSSLLRIAGVFEMSNNVGVSGAGLHLERESYVVFKDRTEFILLNNTAQSFGGGIYVNFDTVRTSTYDCWLFLDEIDFNCDQPGRMCPLPNNRFLIRFEHNQAPFGNSVYGSNLFDCPWTPQSNALDAIYVVPTIEEVYAFQANSSSFNNLQLPVYYNPPVAEQINFTIVNTNALFLTTLAEGEVFGDIPVFKYTFGRENISTSINKTIEPGQPFNISLAALDRLGTSVPLTIFSFAQDDQAITRIGTSNRFLLPGTSFANVTLTIFGPQNTTHEVSITSTESRLTVDFKLLVIIKPCSPGFMFNPKSSTCQCAVPDHLRDRVNCDYVTRNISFPQDFWLGFEEENGEYLLLRCYRDFCQEGVSTISLENISAQCRNDRAGILCGGCKDGYSRMLGTVACGYCQDPRTIAYIVLFAAMGIILCVIVCFFEITIADGYLNGFIFYANIFGVYTSTYLPFFGGAARVLVAWLNLHFGFITCFYDQMTELDLVGLTLVFPVYLMILVFFVVLFFSYVNHPRIVALSQQLSLTKFFATILLMTYASLTETCVAILSGSAIGGSFSLRWGRDPNVEYGIDPQHAVLLAVCLLLLLILVPISIILLIPKISFRVPYVKRFKPLIDVFVAPFELEKSFWVSLRLIFRVIIYIIAATGVDVPQLVAMSILIVSLTLVQAFIKPFNTLSRNLVDSFLMFSLSIFSVVAIYLFQKPIQQRDEVSITINIFNYSFLVMFFLLFLHHLLTRFSYSRNIYESVVNAITKGFTDFYENPLSFMKIHCHCFKKKALPEDEDEEDYPASPSNVSGITHASVVLENVRYYRGGDLRLRETLLEDNPPSSTVKSGNRSTEK